MFISGAIASLAGISEVCGIHGYLSENFAIDYGFYGIAATLIGNQLPLPVGVIALLVGCLLTGTIGIQADLGVPSTLVMVIIATFLFGVLMEQPIEKWLQARWNPVGAGGQGITSGMDRVLQERS